MCVINSFEYFTATDNGLLSMPVAVNCIEKRDQIAMVIPLFFLVFCVYIARGCFT